MIAIILSTLFPPRLPGRLHDWPDERADRIQFEEQGWAGNVREHYRDAIARHFAEPRQK